MNRDRQTGRVRLLEQEASCLPALPPTGSQILRSSDTQTFPLLRHRRASIVNSPWCCNTAAALAWVGAKRLIFILVTHTNRTAERQCSRRGWQLFPERPVSSPEVARPRRETNERPQKAFQPPATKTVITAVATQRSSSFLGKVR